MAVEIVEDPAGLALELQGGALPDAESFERRLERVGSELRRQPDRPVVGRLRHDPRRRVRGVAVAQIDVGVVVVGHARPARDADDRRDVDRRVLVPGTVLEHGREGQRLHDRSRLVGPGGRQVGGRATGFPGLGVAYRVRHGVDLTRRRIGDDRHRLPASGPFERLHEQLLGFVLDVAVEREVEIESRLDRRDDLVPAGDADVAAPLCLPHRQSRLPGQVIVEPLLESADADLVDVDPADDRQPRAFPVGVIAVRLVLARDAREAEREYGVTDGGFDLPFEEHEGLPAAEAALDHRGVRGEMRSQLADDVVDLGRGYEPGVGDDRGAGQRQCHRPTVAIQDVAARSLDDLLADL